MVEISRLTFPAIIVQVSRRLSNSPGIPSLIALAHLQCQAEHPSTSRTRSSGSLHRRRVRTDLGKIGAAM
jgi:hypothetical protein